MNFLEVLKALNSASAFELYSLLHRVVESNDEFLTIVDADQYACFFG
jgi:hypothetical protein